MKHVYLLTGRPGSGKTSLVKQVVARMSGQAGGFYTEEIRSGGDRVGFRLVTLDGKEAVLSHVKLHSPYRVSKYGVDIESLDRVGVSAITKAAQEHKLIVIDEIGKMELFSKNFREAVTGIIDSDQKVLGTITLSSDPWIDTIKQHPRVNLVAVTRGNHQQVLAELSTWLNS
jgi:nucleoside-triphosphatase